MNQAIRTGALAGPRNVRNLVQRGTRRLVQRGRARQAAQDAEEIATLDEFLQRQRPQVRELPAPSLRTYSVGVPPQPSVLRGAAGRVGQILRQGSRRLMQRLRGEPGPNATAEELRDWAVTQGVKRLRTMSEEELRRMFLESTKTDYRVRIVRSNGRIYEALPFNNRGAVVINDSGRFRVLSSYPRDFQRTVRSQLRSNAPVLTRAPTRADFREQIGESAYERHLNQFESGPTRGSGVAANYMNRMFGNVQQPPSFSNRMLNEVLEEGQAASRPPPIQRPPIPFNSTDLRLQYLRNALRRRQPSWSARMQNYLQEAIQEEQQMAEAQRAQAATRIQAAVRGFQTRQSLYRNFLNRTRLRQEQFAATQRPPLPFDSTDLYLQRLANGLRSQLPVYSTEEISAGQRAQAATTLQRAFRTRRARRALQRQAEAPEEFFEPLRILRPTFQRPIVRPNQPGEIPGRPWRFPDDEMRASMYYNNYFRGTQVARNQAASVIQRAVRARRARNRLVPASNAGLDDAFARARARIDDAISEFRAGRAKPQASPLRPTLTLRLRNEPPLPLASGRFAVGKQSPYSASPYSAMRRFVEKSWKGSTPPRRNLFAINRGLPPPNGSMFSGLPQLPRQEENLFGSPMFRSFVSEGPTSASSASPFTPATSNVFNRFNRLTPGAPRRMLTTRLSDVSPARPPNFNDHRVTLSSWRLRGAREFPASPNQTIAQTQARINQVAGQVATDLQAGTPRRPLRATSGPSGIKTRSQKVSPRRTRSSGQPATFSGAQTPVDLQTRINVVLSRWRGATAGSSAEVALTKELKALWKEAVTLKWAGNIKMPPRFK